MLGQRPVREPNMNKMDDCAAFTGSFFAVTQTSWDCQLGTAGSYATGGDGMKEVAEEPWLVGLV